MTTQLADPRDTSSRVDLELAPIDDRSWRLCDPRWNPNDAPYVVAYIEQVNDIYEVVWMRGIRRRCRLTSLHECARAGEEQLAADIRPGTRPVEIAAFPPQRGD